jgi:hypothetical protein
MEEWRKIPGYEIYEVSSLGNVRRYGGKGMNPMINKKTGYRVFKVSKPTRQMLRVGRCVCLAFLPLVEGKTTVDHINRERADDRLENLKWADSSEQIINQDRPLGVSGHRNIYNNCGSYQVRLYRHNRQVYYQRFKTLPEAIEARDNFLQNINT